MRIIAGQFRGRPLKALKGDTTRPTTDRVREALMSAIISARGPFDGARVLDAFAGSGALGFEALSRGAAFVLFCEQNRDAQGIVEANARILKLDRSTYRLRRGDALALTASPEAAFDIVFLDPPYAFDATIVAQFVDNLRKAHLLADGALVCYEHAKKDKQSVLAAFDALEYRIVFNKDYGDTSVVAFGEEA